MTPPQILATILVSFWTGFLWGSADEELEAVFLPVGITLLFIVVMVWKGLTS